MAATSAAGTAPQVGGGSGDRSISDGGGGDGGGGGGSGGIGGGGGGGGLGGGSDSGSGRGTCIRGGKAEQPSLAGSRGGGLAKLQGDQRTQMLVVRRCLVVCLWTVRRCAVCRLCCARPRAQLV
jgi:hypothetical protein